MDWTEVKIGTLFNVDVGGDLRKQYFSKTKDEMHPYPIFSNSLERKGLYGFTSNARHPANSITITGRGALGHAEYRDCEFDAIVRLLVLTPKEKIDCRFITYLINSRINFAIESTGVPQLTAPKVLKKKAFIPESVSEQTAIATLLSKVDEAIEATQKSIEAAEKLKKALMQNLLTGKLKPDGTWRSEDEFWEDEKFGKVPVGWEWKRIKNVTSEVQYGLNVSSVENGRYPMFRMNNIIDGKMVSKPMVHVNLSQKDFEKYRVKHGDILFNRTNSLDLVGKVGIYDLEDTDYVFASYLIKLCVDQENDPYFINYFLNSYTGQSSLRSKATPAVSQANINAKSLRNTFVLCPSKDEQIEIVKKLKSVELSKIDKQSKIKSLQRLKKSLMQNLLTGKVRLPEEFIKQFEETLETKKEVV